MKVKSIIAGAAVALLTSCGNMNNPLLTESSAPFGAPQFDKIKTEHYLPAFEEAIAQAKAEIDAIVSNTEAPTFENTIEAMEYSGRTLNNVAGIFYNISGSSMDIAHDSFFFVQQGIKKGGFSCICFANDCYGYSIFQCITYAERVDQTSDDAFDFSS